MTTSKHRPSLTTLRCVSALAGLTDAELESLAKVSSLGSYAAKEAIVTQNALGNSVYLLLSGYAKVVRGGEIPDVSASRTTGDRRIRLRRETTVGVIGPGDLFGELAAFLQTPRSASVVALTAVQAVEVDCEVFVHTFTTNPGLALFMLRYIGQRLILADRNLEVAHEDVTTRVRVLMRNLRELGAEPEELLTKTEIVRMVGATREMVGRIIKTLRGSEDPS